MSKQGNYVRGENHPAAKLTDTQVATIRSLAHAGYTQARIANKFGVSRNTISAIIAGKLRAATTSVQP